MIYQSVSIENVISKIIRDTKITDTSVMMELYEIIPEAIGMMQTRFQLHHTYKDLQINFHKAQLPSGLLVMPAVEYHGHRLHWRHSARAINAPVAHSGMLDNFDPNGVPISAPLQPVRDDLTNEFVTGIIPAVNPVDGYTFISYTLTQLEHLHWHADHYYWVEMGYINTSFQSGRIRVHYYEAPKDTNGNLLVPDNTFYKEAIYYFCRAKLISMGAFEDRWIGEEKCMQRFELNAGRAMDEIDYPTEDQMQQIVANQVRLVPPVHFWDNFGGTREGMIYG